MFLPLAERMVEKMVKEEKIEAEAEVSMVWCGETNSGLFKADQAALVESIRKDISESQWIVGL